jgi:hypothetical protein
MSRVRGARLRVNHLFRITVVGSYEEGVARLLARRVDRTNGCVRVGDGLDSRFEDARMADLYTSRPDGIS